MRRHSMRYLTFKSTLTSPNLSVEVNQGAQLSVGYLAGETEIDISRGPDRLSVDDHGSKLPLPHSILRRLSEQHRTLGPHNVRHRTRLVDHQLNSHQSRYSYALCGLRIEWIHLLRSL